MPDYEYECLDCKRRFVIYLTYDEYGSKSVSCKTCGSDHIKRKLGRIRFARSAESRLEGMSPSGDFDNLDAMEEDPRALGKMMRMLGQESGEELPPEFNEVVGRLESGQHPQEIEKDLPDLGLPDSGGGLAGMDRGFSDLGSDMGDD
jgi:putative FmdB family regulatory protein